MTSLLTRFLGMVLIPSDTKTPTFPTSFLSSSFFKTESVACSGVLIPARRPNLSDSGVILGVLSDVGVVLNVKTKTAYMNQPCQPQRLSPSLLTVSICKKMAFNPRGREVVDEFLVPGLNNDPLSPNHRFVERQIWTLNPEHLPALQQLLPGENSYYACSPRPLVGVRCQRTFEFGTWNMYGDVAKYRNDKNLIFAKKRLFRFARNVDGHEEATNWRMEE